MESFCRPVSNGVWETVLETGFGAATPCIVQTVMIGTSQIALCCLICYRISLLLLRRPRRLVEKFCLKHRAMHFLFVLLAALLAICPIVQLLLGVSIVNLDGETSLAPFEVLSLVRGGITWFSMLLMLLIEMKVYVKNFRWYTRFGMVYVLIAESTLYRFIFDLRSVYNRYIFQMYTVYFSCQVIFTILSVFHLPDLLPYADYSPLFNEDAQDSIIYEALPGKEQICPERRANVFSRLFFTWITPLMQQGVKKPITEADIWRLDSWDQTEELYKNFQRCWEIEYARDKPSLLRALNKSLGARFWLAGIFKICYDASQFVGPLMLNSLLQSMQRGDPAYIGYLYASAIFVGTMAGVLCEGQYFQNVFRVGFRTRAVLVAAIFHKTLRLTQEGRKGFTSGRILNLMTTDAEALQQVSQQLHSVWSAPIRILVCIYLLHKQLGAASLVGASVLLLLFPIQAFMVNKMRKYTREGLTRTDKRIGLISEILAAMDTVKCYAWENSFRSKVLEIRKDELSWFRSAMTLGSINSFLLNSIPVLVTIIAFGLYTLTGGDLTPAKAFTSLSLFAVLRFPLFMLPNIITQIANANVSLQRLQEFLLAEDRVLQPNPPLDGHCHAVCIRNGNFVWDKKAERCTLSNINIKVRVGELVAIVGGTGEGKTSLISAMLGEISSLGDSEVTLRGQVAYVSQISWIYNGTVRNNILFGSPYDPLRYKRAIQVSGLERDLELLPGGDLTEIGERGVNISGGQKQRVSIARAVYMDADVYIFDDPLSALDAHVAREVFELCIQEELCNKTRILATNQLHFLSQVDNILLVQGGRIQEQGKYEDLMKGGPLFKQLMEKAGKMKENSDAENIDDQLKLVNSLKQRSDENNGKMDSTLLAKDNPLKKRGKSTLIKHEERETGIVSWSVLQRYQKALGGSCVVFVFFFCYFMVEATRASSSTWLSVWTNHRSVQIHGPLFYTGVYALFSFLQILTTLSNSLWLITCSLSAAQRMHTELLNAILRAPMSFFNSTPTGRIINRFAKDTGDIDRNIAPAANMFLSSVFQLSSTFVMIGIVNTASLWAILPLLIVFHVLYLYYQSTAREVKRLDSISRSPVYAQFGEALNGLATIRAYKAYDRMAQVNGITMDNSVRFTLVNMSSNRWLGIRLECLGGVMIWMTATFAVLANQRTNQVFFASEMGLLLTYALNITSLMTTTLRQASIGENSFNAVERIGAYSDLVPEASLIVESNRPPSGWPSKGSVEFKNVVMRYRPDLPPVLHGLSAFIQPSEKIGVVGRTGAGKSSMFNTLFRIVEPESGQIIIDSYDICKIGLNDLRKSLSIIPQVPVLFSGTVRFNLDPFQEQNDTELWEALGRAYLKDVIKRNPLGLDTEVSENGENFSVGQRQLLSLARALLRRSKVLVLDEATAAVDVGTDALIQKTIREEFKSCTMLIIAHRLNTIIDCDRVLVLDAGRVKEMASPKELLLNEHSLFYGMVQSTGAANADYLRSIAFGEVDIKTDLKQLANRKNKNLSITTKWDLAMKLISSHEELQVVASREDGDGILRRTNDAISILQDVLQGLHDDEIADRLSRQESVSERWWSSLLKVLHGFSLSGHHVSRRIGLREPLEGLFSDDDDYIELPSTGM